MDAETEKAQGAFDAASGSAAVEREKRKWWVVADRDVRQVTGYSCAPNHRDMWWCPEVGFTGSERHHLFETEADALDKALSELRQEAKTILDRIDALRIRRQNADISDPEHKNYERNKRYRTTDKPRSGFAGWSGWVASRETR